MVPAPAPVQYCDNPPTSNTKMTQVQGNNLLDVLKKKMRQTKEEMEKYKEESEDMQRKLQVEIRRREEVSPAGRVSIPGQCHHTSPYS